MIGNAVPVKYMILRGPYGAYEIIDTSFKGQMKTVAICSDGDNAELVCYALNKAEGYEYPNPRDYE